jgi:hypothetical protein
MAAYPSHSFVGESAVRAAAVRNDFHVGRELTEARVEFVEWDRPCAWDVSGFVLEARAYIDHDDLASHSAAAEVVAVDGLDVGVVAEETPRCNWHLGDTVRGDGLQSGDETHNVVAGEMSSAQFLELRRDGGHSVPGDASELVDAAFPLREQVEELEAGRMRDSLGDSGQLLEERLLRRRLTHVTSTCTVLQ